MPHFQIKLSRVKRSAEFIRLEVEADDVQVAKDKALRYVAFNEADLDWFEDERAIPTRTSDFAVFASKTLPDPDEIVETG